MQIIRDTTLNPWQQTLTEDYKKLVTCNGVFPVPLMPMYSKVKQFGALEYFGAIGYGNGTEHKVLIVTDYDDGILHIGIHGYGYYTFKLDEARQGIAWPYLREKLKIGEWECHLLSVAVITILARIDNDESPAWERPIEYRHEFEI